MTGINGIKAVAAESIAAKFGDIGRAEIDGIAAAPAGIDGNKAVAADSIASGFGGIRMAGIGGIAPAPAGIDGIQAVATNSTVAGFGGIRISGIDGIKAVATDSTAAGFGGIGMAGIDGNKAVPTATGFGAIEMDRINLLYLGSPNSLSDAEEHSFSRPKSNLTSHLFSPLASNIVPSSHCLFCLLTWLSSSLQTDEKNAP